MPRDLRLYLTDILDAIARIEQYLQDIQDLEQFKQDTRTMDALLHNFTVIGEAVKNIPAEMRQKHDHIRWQAIAGLRDIIVHGYFNTEPEIIWGIAQKNLKELKEAVS